MSHRRYGLFSTISILLLLATLAVGGNLKSRHKKKFAALHNYILRFFDLALLAADHYSEEDPDYGKTWMYFPDGDGVPQVANLTEPPNASARGRSQPVKDKVRFELYTR